MNLNSIRVGNTPLYYSVYSVESKKTHIHSRGIVEIIFCLKGTVKFSYAYEEFTLRTGEYISVDRDAYYLYKGRDNILVSFFIDLSEYEDKWPGISNSLFVCEGTVDSEVQYPTPSHDRMKGMLIACLKEIAGSKNEDVIQKIAESMVDLLRNDFDISYYHYGAKIEEQNIMERLRACHSFLSTHSDEKISLDMLADMLGLTVGYLSEFLRKYSIGFNAMLGYIRANESERYLLETDLTITEISNICGFSDPQYYYSNFKKWYRCTPRQFKDRYLSIQNEEMTILSIDSIQDILDQIIIKHYLEMFSG